MEYVIVTRADDVWLVGPFDTSKVAADYGAVAQRRLWGNDPRWQTIRLTDARGLRVEPPSQQVAIVRGAYDRACRVK